MPILASLLAAMLGAAPEGSPPNNAAGISVSTAGAFDACNSTRVSFSPDRQWLAVWTKLGDFPLNSLSAHGGHARINLARTDCLIRSDIACDALEIGIRNRAQSLSWSTDNSLVVLSGGKEVFIVDPNSRDITFRTTIPSAAVSGRFLMAGPFDRQKLTSWVESVRARQRTTIEALYVDRGALAWTTQKKSTAENAFETATGSITIPPFSLPSPAHWREAPRYYEKEGLVAASGALLPQPVGLQKQILQNPQPIIDAETGPIVGAFDDRSTFEFKKSGLSDIALDSLKLDFLTDVAIHQHSGTRAQIEKFLDGSHRLTVAQRGTVVRFDCPNAGRPLGGKQIVPLGVDYLNWGRPGRPLPARLVRQPVPRGLVIFWQGGPGGTFSRGQSHFTEQTWLRRGYDVALIEQTGSADAASLQRLKTEGFNALPKDGSEAAGALLKMPRRYAHVVVVGESFGGIPASVMAARLEDQGYRTDLLLIAPWLVYRDPSDRGGSDEFFRLNPIFARVADAGLFGVPFTRNNDGFGDRMARWRSTFKFGGRALAIFGENDKISRPADLWNDWANDGMATVAVIDKAAHGTVSQRADETIEAWIGGHR